MHEIVLSVVCKVVQSFGTELVQAYEKPVKSYGVRARLFSASMSEL